MHRSYLKSSGMIPMMCGGSLCLGQRKADVYWKSHERSTSCKSTSSRIGRLHRLVVSMLTLHMGVVMKELGTLHRSRLAYA